MPDPEGGERYGFFFFAGVDGADPGPWTGLASVLRKRTEKQMNDTHLGLPQERWFKALLEKNAS